MSRKTLLLIEDSEEFQNFNKKLFEKQGFAVKTAMTLAEARTFLKRKMPDAVILDIGMPDGSGLNFLREFKRTSKTPVLLLTGYDRNEDVIMGFKAGCDDYLPKPYSFGVLLVRIQRLLQNAEQVPETLTRGLLTLRLMPREAYVNGVDLLLTPKDFALLQFFVQNENRLMNADHIFEQVWGHPMASDPRALSMAISRLRKKLNGCGYTITTEYGSGYRFERGQYKGGENDGV